MTGPKVGPKNMDGVVDGERYRTALARAIASDEEAVFLFGAINSNYFVQRHAEENAPKVLPADQALELYDALPVKYQGEANAFAKENGGAGPGAPTIYDDEEEWGG